MNVIYQMQLYYLDPPVKKKIKKNYIYRKNVLINFLLMLLSICIIFIFSNYYSK